ncbi:ABC transporter ATP-binding protein [filamentous cyanobacterium LEGE 11480]|uniref:ABC transporter ATP-binding protein n=1 Tax=Romeriopsis navalis LEGE 11480 TaxID=2777977 RepID=A0A928Z3P4_9CYAN|nr:ABC transporter ATP-binding protein [Romeriopsis navalis]MBE9029448.1 ABC transporter ATP-binding protein [Romeriopsis navalis LEGE 11480]
MKKNSSANQNSSYQQLLPYVRQQRGTFFRAFLCTLVFNTAWPLLAHQAQRLVPYINEGKVLNILDLVLFVAAIWAVQKIAQFGQDTLSAKGAFNVAHGLRKDLFGHLQSLSLSYFETAPTGDLTYRVTEDVNRIGDAAHKFFHQFIPCLLQLATLLAYIIWLNWQLTLAIFLIAPVMALLIGWFGERMRRFSYRSQKQLSELSSQLVEIFGGIRLIKAFAAESEMYRRFEVAAEHNRTAKYNIERLRAIEYPVVGFILSISVLMLFVLAGWQIQEGNLTGAAFASYAAAVAMLIDPVNILANNFNDFKQGEASVDRIFELKRIAPTVKTRPNAIVMPEMVGKVEFQQVDFEYEADRPVLQGLDVTAMPGQMTALVGASGAGKTTLVNLIPRFYDPQGGQIRIDDMDIRDATLTSLRRQIGIVPQETTLFAGTIAENIAFGQSKFDLAAVESAAKIANAHRFISQFPQGYQTWVGERGVNLSGGQRQRIAIARAILLDPKILILDEATSALDSESEALVQEALERIMQGRTVFIIAHRLATVRRVDRILVMEKGQVVEAGTHEELIAEQGRYAGFYAQQFAS